MKSKQVLVSGATGFVGQHLIPLLLQDGYDVIALARDRAKAERFDWFDRTTFVPLDFHLENPSFEFEQGASLIHLAWQGLPNYTSLFHFEENLPKNCFFIKRLILSGISKVFVAGTCFEYGFRSGPISVSDGTAPANPYALAKDCLRKYLYHLKSDNPFILQWARLFYMHGPGQNPRSVLALLDAAIARGDPIFNMSGGEQLRDYLSIEEVARKILERFNTDADGTFNICSGNPISIRRLVEERIAQKNSDIRMNLGYYPYPDYEPMAFWGVV